MGYQRRVHGGLRNAKEEEDFSMVNNVREMFMHTRNGAVTRSMTWGDFEVQIKCPQMQNYFKAIDVDPSEAKGVFELLDIDDSGTIDVQEFISGCVRLRGPAKALELAVLQHELHRMSTCFQAHAQYVEARLAGVESCDNPVLSPV